MAEPAAAGSAINATFVYSHAGKPWPGGCLSWPSTFKVYLAGVLAGAQSAPARVTQDHIGGINRTDLEAVIEPCANIVV